MPPTGEHNGWRMRLTLVSSWMPEKCMTKNHTLKNILPLVISGVFLAIVIVACAGGQPPATGAPAEPTSEPKTAPATAYPVPEEKIPYPSVLSPYPPAGQIISPYPEPLQPYPGPLEPYPAPWQPQASDENLQRGEAFIDEMDILVMESYPPQYTLTLQGTLPTPCHQLRVEVAPPDSKNVIQVNAYSVVDPSVICTQVLSPFEASVPLQGLPSGKYTVVVNGKEAGSIEMP
jgi:hypothetical protein